MFLNKIFAGAVIGGSAAAAWSYANLPVFAVAPVAESATWGLGAGVLLTTALYCASPRVLRSTDGASILGTLFVGMGGIFAGCVAVIDSSESFQEPMENSAYAEIFNQYGEDLQRLEAGHRIPFDADLGRGVTLPMMAEALEDPRRYVVAPGDGGEVRVRVCANFELAHNPPPGETESDIVIEDTEVEMCRTRFLTPDEWNRILTPVN